MRRILWVLAFGLATSAAVWAAADETFGSGVKLTEATPIKSLYEDPKAFVGKTIRLDGVVTAVCDAMGCWMALAPAEQPDQTVRLKVDHGAGIVFPLSARGKKASAEGVFEAIAAGDHEANEAAREQAAAQPTGADFGTKYQIKATGAVVR
jgi:Domain of unknown function (DUF4920)